MKKLSKIDLKWLMKQHARRDEIKGGDLTRYTNLTKQRLEELRLVTGEKIKADLGLSDVKADVFVEPNLPGIDTHAFELYGRSIVLVGGQDEEGKPQSKQNLLDSARHELAHIVNPRRTRRGIDTVPSALYELDVYNTEKKMLSLGEWNRVKEKRKDRFLYNYWNFLSGRQQKRVRPALDKVFLRPKAKVSRTRQTRRTRRQARPSLGSVRV